MEAINVENLVKKYKNGVQALNGISLTVKKGEIFCLLGQNGAGKSTLINILTTYLRPTSGEITMLNKDIYTEADMIRTHIACVAQRTSIDSHLSLVENMIFQSRLYKIPKEEADKRMKSLISCFSLNKYLKYPVPSYSGGVKRRLDIALNLMSNPQILFLDEPTVGMDIQSRIAMWDMMKKIRNDFETTIFLTTHYLEEADQLSDTICIMRDGKEVIQGAPHELREYTHQDMLKLTFANKENVAKCYQSIQRVNNFKRVTLREKKIIISSDDSKTDLINVMNWLLEQQIVFMGIEISQPTLEDVFIHLTSKQK